MIGDLHLPIPPDRVVTEDCYPYQPPQQTPAEVGRCMMQSRSVGRGKRQATQRCPNTQNYHNDIYQSTPPYRLSSNVSERKLHKAQVYTKTSTLAYKTTLISHGVSGSPGNESEIVEGQWDVLFFFVCFFTHLFSISQEVGFRTEELALCIKLNYKLF